MVFGLNRKIFSNCFTLNIKNQNLQARAELEIGEKKVVMIIYILAIIIIIATGLSEVCPLDLSRNKINNYNNPKGLIYLGYASVVPTSVSLILYLFNLKYPKVTYAMLFFILVSLFMSLQFFIEYYSFFLNRDFKNYDCIAFAIYSTGSISYIIFVDNNFLRIFMAHAAIICLNLAAFSSTFFKYSQVIDLSGSYIIRICLFYFMCRISKISYYYKEKFELQKNWAYDILNHSNGGLIIYNVKKQKVKFFNDYLKKFEQFKPNENADYSTNSLYQDKQETSETSDLHNQTPIHDNNSVRNVDNQNNSKLLLLT